MRSIISAIPTKSGIAFKSLIDFFIRQSKKKYKMFFSLGKLKVECAVGLYLQTQDLFYSFQLV